METESYPIWVWVLTFAWPILTSAGLIWGGGGETAAVEIPSRHADITGRALTDSAPHALACK